MSKPYGNHYGLGNLICMTNTCENQKNSWVSCVFSFFSLTDISFQLENNFLSILSRETFHCACTLMGQIKHSLCSSPSPTTYVLDFHNEAVKARMLMARNVFWETKEHIF